MRQGAAERQEYPKMGHHETLPSGKGLWEPWIPRHQKLALGKCGTGPARMRHLKQTRSKPSFKTSISSPSNHWSAMCEQSNGPCQVQPSAAWSSMLCIPRSSSRLQARYLRIMRNLAKVTWKAGSHPLGLADRDRTAPLLARRSP